jgi:pSer/pThr/pTyr-binding forkhead associated (FHA) protein
VGRDPDVDVRLDSESVSRRHAAIIESGGRYYLRDLQSKNGTYLHGVLQSAEQPLADGDRFRIGSSDFVFRLRESK